MERARYGLSLIEELFEAEPESIKHFLQVPDPYISFSRIMQTKSDSYCAAKAVKLVSLLIIKSPEANVANVVAEVLRWCNEKLRNVSDISIGLEGLQTLLRNDTVRQRFTEDDGIARLGNVLKTANLSSQIVYKTLYCLWLLSYNEEIGSKFSQSTVIHKIVDVLKIIQKEKVSRMGLAILANIANKGDNNQQMIEAKLQRVLELLNQKRWADEDMEHDLKMLTELVEKSISEMSSWDAYKTELMSKDLEWSPVHTSERFWRENVNKFEENNFEVLSMLTGLLNSQNNQVLQVVCHDIGEFIRFHPRGRDIFSDKMKSQKFMIMKLMEHPDTAVQKEALLCTQKLLVFSWESLGK